MFDKIIERIVRKVIKERLDQVVDEIGKGYNIEVVNKRLEALESHRFNIVREIDCEAFIDEIVKRINNKQLKR
jgi:hypothetical protein